MRYTSAPGDLLYVREQIDRHESGGICYRADGALHPDAEWVWKPKTLPAMYMPKGLRRTILRVVDVRVERLLEITEADCIAEGIEPRQNVADPSIVMGSIGLPCGKIVHGLPIGCYKTLWDHINGKRPGCSWASNPWVFDVEFRRVPEAEVRSW